MILSLGLAAAPPRGVAQGSRVETGPASQPNNSDEIRIDGRAIAIDREGKEHPNENGKFTAWIGPGVDSRNETVRVVDGRWTLVARRNALLSIAKMKLGSEAALVSDGTNFKHGGIPVPADGLLTVRGTWLPKTTIRVVDGAGGGAISNVSVVTGLAPTRDDAMDPSTLSFGTAVVATGDSPVQVEWRSGVLSKIRYWVRAPGYAWESLEIDHVKGGEHTVALEHEGTFVVKWNALPPDGAAVRLYRADAKDTNYCSRQKMVFEARADPHRREHAMDPDAQFPCGTAESIRIDAIKRGRYLIAIEVGDKDARPFVLGERWIDVALGDSGTFEVILGSMPEVASGSISGILVLAPESEGSNAWISVSQSDAFDSRRSGRKVICLRDMEPIVGKPREYAWHTESLPVGEYRICAMPGPISKSVELTSEGLRDLRLELPTMVTVNLHLVDADTGAGIEADNVEWKTDEDRAPPEVGWYSSMMSIARRTKESGVWTFLAPAGFIDVEVTARGYTPSWTERIDVVPGRSELTIRAARAMGVRIRVVDKATNSPIEGDDVAFYGLVDPVDGNDKTDQLWHGGPVAVAYVTTPGKYRIRLRPPDGYKKPKNKIVTIEKGQFTDVVFALEKSEK
jgi:hypothetical protein